MKTALMVVLMMMVAMVGLTGCATATQKVRIVGNDGTDDVKATVTEFTVTGDLPTPGKIVLVEGDNGSETKAGYRRVITWQYCSGNEERPSGKMKVFVMTGGSFPGLESTGMYGIVTWKGVLAFVKTE